MITRLLPFILGISILGFGCDSKPAETASLDSSTTTSGTSTPAETPAETPTEPAKPEPAPADQTKATDKPPYADTVVLASDVVVIETSMGTMKAKFFLDKAPNHAKNFAYLAKKGFYDGTRFHRVIKGFMIQGGDPNTKPGGEKNGPPGTGGPGYNVKNEFNNTSHVGGILSMARSQDPDSAGSQFFVVHKTAPHLDGQYTAFGKLISGMDVLEKIANVRTQPGDAPVEPVILKSIKIIKG
jgi:cyclophilin family peptidyl-prolyl cis-trans isomerase